MPLYDFECKECKKVFEHFCRIADLEKVRCNCGGRAVSLITNTHSQDWFKPHWNEHLDIEPIFVKSREHYKQLCRERNLTPRCFGDVRRVEEV